MFTVFLSFNPILPCRLTAGKRFELQRTWSKFHPLFGSRFLHSSWMKWNVSITRFMQLHRLIQWPKVTFLMELKTFYITLRMQLTRVRHRGFISKTFIAFPEKQQYENLNSDVRNVGAAWKSSRVFLGMGASMTSLSFVYDIFVQDESVNKQMRGWLSESLYLKHIKKYLQS